MRDDSAGHGSERVSLRWRHLPCAALLLILSSPAPADEIGHVLRREVPERLDCPGGSTLDRPQTAVALTMARGESEMIYLLGPAPSEVTASATPVERGEGLELEAFRVGSITIEPREGFGRARRFDPLLPVGTTPDGEADGCALTAIKVSTKSTTSPGDRTLRLALAGPFGERTLDLPVSVRDIVLSPAVFPDFQANFDRRGFDCAKNIELYRQLADFGVNIATGLGSPDCYARLFEDERFRGARLPGLALPKKLAGRPSPGEAKRIVGRLSEMLEPFSDMLAERPDAFHVKLLDEPQEGEFELIDALFATLERTMPDVRTEYSGHYRGEAVDLADINVNQIRRLTPAYVREVRARNKKLWVYANAMLRPEKPYGTLRGMGFLLSRLGADGYHLWNATRCVADWRRETAYWKRPSENGGRKLFSGSGCLLYPVGDTYLTSLRLEALRDAAEDYAIATLTGASAGDAVDERVAEVSRFTKGSRSYAFDARALHDELLDVHGR